MKQRILDYILLLKKDRKTQIISGVVGFFALAFIFMAPPPQHGGAPQQAPEIGIGAPKPEESYKELIDRFDQHITELEGGMRGVREEIGDIRTDHENFQKRTAVIFEKILNRMTDINDNGSGAQQGDGQFNPVDVTPENTGPQGEAGGEVTEVAESLEPLFDGSGQDAQPLPPQPPERAKNTVIMPGDTVRLKLLAGVNAPVSGTPYPTMFKLVSDVGGPDGSSLPLGEARLIAAAQGSLTDGRVLFRLTDLSMRFPNGQRKTVQVDGWIVGEDGVRGMQGRVIDQLGRALGGAALVGASQGVGQGIAQSQLTNVVTEDGASISTATGDIATLGLGTGLNNSFGTWNRIIQERLADMVPVVEVLSGREATAVFARPVVIDELYDHLAEDEIVFASLD